MAQEHRAMNRKDRIALAEEVAQLMGEHLHEVDLVEAEYDCMAWERDADYAPMLRVVTHDGRVVEIKFDLPEWGKD